MATKTRSVPENFDTKKALNPLEAKILRHQQNTANVPLDSGAIAKLVNKLTKHEFLYKFV